MERTKWGAGRATKKNDPKDKENNYFALEMKAIASSKVGAYAVAYMHEILFVWVARSFEQ